MIEEVYFLVTQSRTIVQEGTEVSKHNLKKKIPNLSALRLSLQDLPSEVPGVISGDYL